MTSLTRGIRYTTNFLKQGLRQYSSSKKLLDVSINDSNGIATVTMTSPPVNSLNLELLTEFNRVLDQLEQDKPSGMILTSISDKVFSAGLDILEMHRPESSRLTLFWRTLQDVWMKLYGTTFPTVAVVNGHAPAGGCLLSMCCDYRVMLENFTIGLNETQLGIVAPSWFIATMNNTIGFRQTELALTRGTLFKTAEALKIGLVDEVVAKKEEAVLRAEKFLKKYENIPPLAYSATKGVLRGPAIQALQNTREADIKILQSFLAREEVQQSLEFYLAMLKSRKESK